MTITFFTTKLENFVHETNVSDGNLLMLLSHLTDSIQAFVLAAKIVQTNHTIESFVDKSILSCEHIFECLACNMQTGKTYNSVVNHVSTTKHIAHAKQFVKQKPPQPLASKNSNATTIHGDNCQLPVSNGPLPSLQNHVNNLNSQPVHLPLVPPIQRSVLLQPIVVPPLSTLETLHNYKDLFRMPLATNVVGFQQNVVSPSNNFLNRNVNKTNEESDKETPILVVKKQRNRIRNRRRTKIKSSTSQPVEIDVKSLDETTISFLKGNVEEQVVQYIKAAELLVHDDLYADITMNLQECCREMDLNVEVKCFGSRIIGIGSAKSDVDMNISVTGECKRPNVRTSEVN